jgi:hypothetical protein
MKALDCGYCEGIDRRRFIKGGVLGMLGLGWSNHLCISHTPGASEGETLYNGIQQPSPFPPRDRALTLDPPAPPPYLTSPPAVIPIDVGRQLFVDDFLIEQTTLTRTFHSAEYHPATPVLKPDRPWEQEGKGPMAMPFSSGIWFDPQDRLFKMWYMGGYNCFMCYATSQDGLHWEKPALDVRAGTNIVRVWEGANVVWLDLEEEDPQRRYKLITTGDGSDLIGPSQEWYGSQCSMFVHFSPDGIHWSEAVVRTGATGDRNSAFWNAFRQVWVYSIRAYLPFGGPQSPMRCRRYWETSDLTAGAPWKPYEPPLWVGADNSDLRRPDLPTVQPELYNLDCAAYESVLLGLFSILRGYPPSETGRPKINEVCVGYSRDGFHWHRPERRPLVPVSERQGDWNWGNMQSAGGCCLVTGDHLYFYVSGRAGRPSDAGGSTGLATLRRDGFASLDAGGTEETLTTRPVRFRGRYLFVNVDADAGELRVEVLDESGKVIAPFSRANGVPIRADQTLQAVQWQGAEDLSALAGKPVKFRFHLRNGSLYAFWVSSNTSGASHGYVAAGGPGFTSPRDTVGAAAYRAR